MNSAKKIAKEHPFMNPEVIMNFSNGVVETLQTMASTSSTFEKGFVEKNWQPNTDYSVFLDLQSPPFTGQIRFHFAEKSLVELYKKMIDENASPKPSDIVDCLGEISNMCYGYARGRLNEKDFTLKMTLPHPGRTADLPQVFSRKPHIILPFKVFEEICYIQIVIF